MWYFYICPYHFLFKKQSWISEISQNTWNDLLTFRSRSWNRVEKMVLNLENCSEKYNPTLLQTYFLNFWSISSLRNENGRFLLKQNYMVFVKDALVFISHVVTLFTFWVKNEVLNLPPNNLRKCLIPWFCIKINPFGIFLFHGIWLKRRPGGHRLKYN